LEEVQQGFSLAVTMQVDGPVRNSARLEPCPASVLRGAPL